MRLLGVASVLVGAVALANTGGPAVTVTWLDSSGGIVDPEGPGLRAHEAAAVNVKIDCCPDEPGPDQCQVVFTAVLSYIGPDGKAEIIHQFSGSGNGSPYEAQAMINGNLTNAPGSLELDVDASCICPGEEETKVEDLKFKIGLRNPKRGRPDGRRIEPPGGGGVPTPPR